jgi:hypothetical protein
MSNGPWTDAENDLIVADYFAMLAADVAGHNAAHFAICLTCLTIGVFSTIRQEAPMKEERVTPLRQRMIEDMRIRGMGDKAQKSHIRAIKDFAAFLGRSPDTATPEDLRAYQLHMTDTGITPSTFNTRIVALRFFFGMTCGREEMKR